MTRGGYRDGSGRKPNEHGKKKSLTVRLSPDVLEFLASTGNSSLKTEETIRKSSAFKVWLKAQKKGLLE